MVQKNIDNISWTEFSTAYGSAETVPAQLKTLLFGSDKQALESAHGLWCGLCHQHAYISSAALPAFPFLLEALVLSHDNLKVEILDIFMGFSVCLKNDINSHNMEAWKVELLKNLNQQNSLFEELKISPNGNISVLAGEIIEVLESIN